MLQYLQAFKRAGKYSRGKIVAANNSVPWSHSDSDVIMTYFKADGCWTNYMQLLHSTTAY